MKPSDLQPGTDFSSKHHFPQMYGDVDYIKRHKVFLLFAAAFSLAFCLICKLIKTIPVIMALYFENMKNETV